MNEYEMMNTEAPGWLSCDVAYTVSVGYSCQLLNVRTNDNVNCQSIVLYNGWSFAVCCRRLCH